MQLLRAKVILCLLGKLATEEHIQSSPASFLKMGKLRPREQKQLAPTRTKPELFLLLK
jgi:hypothetical protein